MVTKQVVELVCDVDGSEATQSIPFSIDGVAYEIDVCDTHAEKLRAAVESYATAGRKIPGPAWVGARKRPRTHADRNRAEQIRDRARAAGVPVADRGRIPAHVVQRFG